MIKLLTSVCLLWVMWQMTGQKSGDYIWKAVNSYPSASECRVELRVKVDRVSHVQGAPSPPTTILNYYQATRAEDPSYLTWYGCFPPEYDPYEKH